MARLFEEAKKMVEISMKTKVLVGMLLITIALAGIMSPTFALDTLLVSDFKQESWGKTIDFFDYARAYATLHGMIPPPSNLHAYLYTTYVNTKGLQMLYAGLCNITANDQTYLTIPMQTFMMHYKTDNRSRDVLMASTFLMLLAFNETTSSLYQNSPDMNDQLWASFSLGLDFSAFNVTLPALNTRTIITPLSHSDDKLRWSWGMKYTNLTAVWWRTWVSPTTPHFNNTLPLAVTTYDELTFNYTLTISPETHKATLTENHDIGRIRHLWRFWMNQTFPWFHYRHYNSTGSYNWGRKISNETVYQFIQHNQIKMSIVDFQTSIMLDRETTSVSADGQNVTDTDRMVSGSSITTYADDGERVFDATFGAKQNYKLFNYTADPSESTYDTYNATTRTCKINGFAKNTGLFSLHIGLMKFMPLLVANMYPQLYQKAKESITNMTQANYFYLIAYPEYSGFRVEHDPIFTVYLDTGASDLGRSPWGLILIATIAVVIIIAAFAVLKLRRKPKTSDESQVAPPEPPTV